MVCVITKAKVSYHMKEKGSSVYCESTYGVSGIRQNVFNNSRLPVRPCISSFQCNIYCDTQNQKKKEVENNFGVLRHGNYLAPTQVAYIFIVYLGPIMTS